MNITSWLSLVFFLSGVSALIYQVVWQRLLTLYYGVGAVSIVLIVSIYMAGLGLGSLLGGFLAERIKNKIRVYFFIEFLIGCFGLLSISFLRFWGQKTAGGDYWLSAVYMSVFLMFPTVLMGITLPLLTKIFNSFVRNFFDTVSSLYFINTLGASVGALVSSFVLISFFGLDRAVYSAAGINFLLVFLIFFLQKVKPCVELSDHQQLTSSAGLPVVIVYVLVMFTGFLAIGYEIVWFRILGILLKNSAYVFPSILAIYLLGIALGSFGMKVWLNKNERIDRRRFFFQIQFCAAFSVLAIFLAYFFATKYTDFSCLTRESFRIDPHPYIRVFTLPWAADPKYLSLAWYSLLDILFWPLLFVLIPTFFMGASFPLISSLALVKKNEEGRTVARVYFFNILGNVLGGVVTGFVLLVHFGSESTVLGFVAAGLLFGLCLIERGHSLLRKAVKAVTVFLIIGLAVIAFPKRGELYTLMHNDVREGSLKLELEEGLEGVIATYHDGGERVINYINGSSHGGRPGYRFQAQALEAIGFAPHAKRALVIGYGTGSTLETVLKMDTLEEIVLVELNGTLITNLKKIPFFAGMLKDPRLTVVIEDGRRYLLRSGEKFDLVLIDPFRTVQGYSNNLFSKEFFEIVRAHLSLGGVFMVWMDEIMIVSKTAATVFEDARLYLRNDGGFCIASNRRLTPDDKTLRRVLARFDPVSQQGIINSSTSMWVVKPLILKITQNYPINQDLRPVTEYYIGAFVRNERWLSQKR